jgi:hypothetical protein
MQTATAWLTTDPTKLAGLRAEVTVIHADDEGAALVLAEIVLDFDVTIDQGDQDDVRTIAENALREHGWETAGEWKHIDSGAAVDVQNPNIVTDPDDAGGRFELRQIWRLTNGQQYVTCNTWFLTEPRAGDLMAQLRMVYERVDEARAGETFVTFLTEMNMPVAVAPTAIASIEILLIKPSGYEVDKVAAGLVGRDGPVRRDQDGALLN